MPTVFVYHDVKDKDHWLASPKREEFLGPLGVTNIRLFADPENPTRVGGLMDVSDMDAVMAGDEDRGGRRGDGVRRSLARDAGDSRRGLTDPIPDCLMSAHPSVIRSAALPFR